MTLNLNIKPTNASIWGVCQVISVVEPISYKIVKVGSTYSNRFAIITSKSKFLPCLRIYIGFGITLSRIRFCLCSRGRFFCIKLDLNPASNAIQVSELRV
ncbi:hypothetical protein D3C75_571700 [compost metagenome]